MSLPTVSVIVTSYQPKAKEYLDLCVRSIKNLNYPSELLDVIIVAPKSYAPEYGGVRTLSPDEPEYGMPRGLNFGMQASSGEYMLVLNDDVILTAFSLDRMLGAMRPEVGLLMPIGNDQQGRYHIPLAHVGPYTLNDIAASLHEDAAGWLMNQQSPLFASERCGGLLFADTLCLYAFMIRREVFARVGPFDETLIGQDDIDYSLRMRQAGLLNAITLDALVWHAGGASNQLTPEQREKSMRIFNEKWGR